MKYDDSEYYLLNFETGLDPQAASTHIGMYLAWALQTGLTREDEPAGWAQAADKVRARMLTGGQLLTRLCDGKLTDAEFNVKGNAFTADYYEKEYRHDYARVFDGQIPSTGHDADDLCSVPDTWANFDLLKPVLDARLTRWRAGRAAAQSGVPAELAALHRRAEGGDGQAAFMLARAYRRGNDIPPDWVAADALLLLAQDLGVAEAVEYPRVLPNNAEPAALAAQLRQPGQLTVLLAERHRQRMKAVPAAATGPAAPSAPGRQASPAWIRLALVVGAANLLSPLLLVSLGDRPALAVKITLALIGAAGVFAAAPSRRLRGAARLLLTAITAVLGAMGGLVCLWLLLRKPAADAGGD